MTLAVAFATFGACPSALAKDPQIVHLAKDDPAPFTGDLYPVDLSIRFALAIEACDDRRKAALDHLSKLHDIELTRVQSLAQASADADARRVELLKAQLDESRAWYRSTPFVATVAVVSTVAILLTSTVLVQATGEVWR